MGPIALFDKSFLQSLTLDESVWFDHFFYSNICPLFYVETLADLTKSTDSSGRTAEDAVRIIADKTPVKAGGPCAHHRELCISNLMGQPIPMRGQIPMAGGRPTQSTDGKRGHVFNDSPEAKAFSRWQKRHFQEIEHHHARDWREMLTRLDLPATALRMRALGITSKECKTIEQAHTIAAELVLGRNQPFEQMALLFSFVDIPPELQRPILQRWAIDQNRPLGEYAPYAAHVLTVELFFQIALAANLISDGRASNRVDISYLCYLPFCMLFISSDKLHKKCTSPFLRKDQTFVWGPDLKSELKRQNTEFAKLPPSVLETGLMNFARSPIGTEGDLLLKLWDQYIPGWRSKTEKPVPLTQEAEKKLVEKLRTFSNAPTAAPPDIKDETELEQMVIERHVPKRKGSWWLLPKNLKASDDEASNGA
jgi:hypothetical protein